MDNFKVIYKILRTLEKSMDDEQFSVLSISAQKMGITFERWEKIMIMMQDEGFIKGIVVSRSLEDNHRHIQEPIYPEITIKGLEYLDENSMMAKAKSLLKAAGEIF